MIITRNPKNPNDSNQASALSEERRSHKRNKSDTLESNKNFRQAAPGKSTLTRNVKHELAVKK